jgi:hypothetical protein
MLTNSLPTNATSTFETRLPRVPPANVPPLTEGSAERRQVEPADRIQACPPCRVATDTIHPVVEISPPDSVERRTATWPGMTAEIVQVTRSDRLESFLRAGALVGRIRARHASTGSAAAHTTRSPFRLISEDGRPGTVGSPLVGTRLVSFAGGTLSRRMETVSAPRHGPAYRQKSLNRFGASSV